MEYVLSSPLLSLPKTQPGVFGFGVEGKAKSAMDSPETGNRANAFRSSRETHYGLSR